ncbi:MAG: hypothetical protein PV340_05275 [Wolbachia sp.]|nr:hypothetical protein [Wolbachia sp.]MDD9336006.1 hypothetical protein [Wolbachia sp.]
MESLIGNRSGSLSSITSIPPEEISTLTFGPNDEAALLLQTKLAAELAEITKEIT